MARSKEFLRNRDIDWAVQVGNNYIHVASAGGDLPKIVDANLFDIWRELKDSQYLCDRDDVVLNYEYLNEKFEDLRDISSEEKDFRFQWYVCSFVEMARRGYYSFDRDIRTSFNENKYRLVASPGRMEQQPVYNLPSIDINIKPEELDGSNIVKLIDEVWSSNNE